MARVLISLCIALLTGPAWAQFTAANAEWNRPVRPFRIAGNLYYVGAAGVSSFLIATEQGSILIDGGFRETAPQIEASIRQLGFRVEDVRILLNTHEHFDHAGGLAALKSATHARLLVNPAAVPLLTSGGRGDFAFHDRYLFPPVTPDGALQDGEPVRLGSAVLVPHFTPGHTRGCTTWTMTVEQAGKPLHVVIACSLSAPDYQLVNNPAYPGIVADYEGSFGSMRLLPCDIFLSPHGWDFELKRRAEAVAHGDADAFIDRGACSRYIEQSKLALEKQVARQRTQEKAATAP